MHCSCTSQTFMDTKMVNYGSGASFFVCKNKLQKPESDWHGHYEDPLCQPVCIVGV